MENWKQILPIFLISVGVGVTANLIFFTKNEAITKKRMLKEIFGALWIAFGAYFFLKQYTRLLDGAIYFICSVVGFVNSQIISFLGNDLIQAVGKGIVKKIRVISGQTQVDVSVKELENKVDGGEEPKDM